MKEIIIVDEYKNCTHFPSSVEEAEKIIKEEGGEIFQFENPLEIFERNSLIFWQEKNQELLKELEGKYILLSSYFIRWMEEYDEDGEEICERIETFKLLKVELKTVYLCEYIAEADIKRNRVLSYQDSIPKDTDYLRDKASDRRGYMEYFKYFFSQVKGEEVRLIRE